MPALRTTWQRLSRWFPFACSTLRCVAGWWRSRVFWALILLGVLAWQVENHRGARRLEAAKESLRRAGVMSLDWRDYHRKGKVPDDQNLAKQPPFNSVKVLPAGDSYFADIESAVRPLFEGIPQGLLNGQVGSLEEWADRLDPGGSPERAAGRVLEATQSLEPKIQELHEALQMDQCQWMKLDIDGLNMAPVPQIADMTDTARMLASLLLTRARAHLECGEPERAARAVVTVVNHAELGRFEPGSLVGALVRQGMSRQTLRADFHGLLTQEGWDDASLAEIQESLRSIDLLGHLRRSLEAEATGVLAFGTALMNDEPWTRDLWGKGWMMQDFGPEVGKGQWDLATFRWMRNHFYHRLPRVMPRGWYAQNMATVLEWWDAFFLAGYDPRSRRVWRTELPDRGTIAEAGPNPYNFLAMLSMPELRSLFETGTKAQTRWDLLRVVCALQRHRLRSGDFPETLESLVSRNLMRVLPHDYVSGKPPVYDRAGKTFTWASLDWMQTGRAEDLLCQIPETDD